MVDVRFVVQGERIALPFARHVVLPYLGFLQHYAAVVVHGILELGIVRTAGSILVRARNHHTQLVVEEAVAVGQPQVELCVLADGVVATACRGTEDAAVGRVLGHEVDAAPDGVAVHVGCHHLVHLDGLHHVGRDEVQLHVARVALGRGDAVAVDGDRTEVGTCAAHLPEAGFALVILHVDAADAFQRIADVRVGELPHLVGRHHIGDAHIGLLRIDGAALPRESTSHDHLLQFDAFMQCHVLLYRLAFGDADGHLYGRVTHVAHFHLVGARFEIGKRVEAVDVADDTRMQLFDVDGCSRQNLLGSIDDTSPNAALLVDFSLSLGPGCVPGCHESQ